MCPLTNGYALCNLNQKACFARLVQSKPTTKCIRGYFMAGLFSSPKAPPPPPGPDPELLRRQQEQDARLERQEADRQRECFAPSAEARAVVVVNQRSQTRSASDWMSPQIRPWALAAIRTAHNGWHCLWASAPPPPPPPPPVQKAVETEQVRPPQPRASRASPCDAGRRRLLAGSSLGVGPAAGAVQTQTTLGPPAPDEQL